MSKDEEYVRSVWERVRYSEEGLTPAGPCYVVISAEYHPTAGTTIFTRHGATREAVFAAAAEFTRDRQEQMRQLREEIDSTKSNIKWFDQGSRYDDNQQSAIHSRILSRLEAELATITRGMKPEAEGATR